MRALALTLVLLSGCATVIPESTFFGMCWVGNRAAYPVDPHPISYACSKPRVAYWEHLKERPLRILVLDYKTEAEYAIKEWNRVRKNTFVVTDKPPFDVRIASESPRGKAAAITIHKKIEGELKAYIEVWRPGLYFDTHFMLVHELGHVLGLAHDFYPRSIMFPIVGYGFISDADKKAIRRLYAPVN